MVYRVEKMVGSSRKHLGKIAQVLASSKEQVLRSRARLHAARERQGKLIRQMNASRAILARN